MDQKQMTKEDWDEVVELEEEKNNYKEGNVKAAV